MVRGWASTSLFFQPEFEDIFGKERSRRLFINGRLSRPRCSTAFSHTLAPQAQTGRDVAMLPVFHGSIHRFFILAQLLNWVIQVSNVQIVEKASR